MRPAQAVSLYGFIERIAQNIIDLILPLYLVSLGIGLGPLGLLISLLPTAFVFSRIFLAAYSETRGVYPLFFLGFLSRVSSSLIYFLPLSIPLLVLSKLLEGLSFASFWAVNRKAVYELEGSEKADRSGSKSAVMTAAGEAGIAAGKILGGILLGILSFRSALFFPFLFSISLYLPLKILSKIPRKSPSGRRPGLRSLFLEGVRALDIRGKSAEFKRLLWLITFGKIPDALAFSFLLPVFLKLVVKLSYLQVGLALAVFSLTSAAFTFLFHRLKLDRPRKALALLMGIPGSVLFLLLLLADSFSEAAVVLFFLGVTDAIRRLYWESLVSYAVHSDRNGAKKPALTVAIIGTPVNIVAAIVTAFAGWFADYLGFGPVFLTVALGNAAFTLFSQSYFDRIPRPEERRGATVAPSARK